MITKITVDFPYKFSMERYDDGSFGTVNDWLTVDGIGTHLKKIAAMISYAEQYPTTPVDKLINIFFSDSPHLNVSCKEYSKTKRVHSFWLCYIHEEDKG